MADKYVEITLAKAVSALCLRVVYEVTLQPIEELRLWLGDMRHTENLLYIRKHKGNKDRHLPLSQTLLNPMEAYNTAYRPQELLFEGRGRGAFSWRSVERAQISACLIPGIEEKKTLYALRHSRVTQLLEQGIGFRYIQEVPEHNSPKANNDLCTCKCNAFKSSGKSHRGYKKITRYFMAGYIPISILYAIK